MIKVSINSVLLQRNLSRLASNVGPAGRSTANAKISIDMQGRVFRNFRDEVGEGRPWVPLKPETIRRKKLRGYSKILQNTGALRQSFLPFSDADEAGVGAIAIAGAPDKRRPDIAKFHQYGTSTIPARPMLPSREEALGIGVKIYQKHVAGAIT